MADSGMWQLRKGDVVLGSLEFLDGDFPWLHGDFSPSPAFDEVRPLFDRERAALEAENWQEHDRVWEAILAYGITLEAPDGKHFAEFMLHLWPDSHARWMC